MCSTTAGSTSPHRVPITSPSSGVIPIDVSTHAPPHTAATLQPLPAATHGCAHGAGCGGSHKVAAALACMRVHMYHPSSYPSHGLAHD
eukprot:365064-Chlamydomonas_euryale.AAC.1